MGKTDNQRLPAVQQSNGGSSSGNFFHCRRCAMGCYRLASVKCGVMLMLSLAAFLSAFFWLLPFPYRQAGFDSKDSIKLSATVQSYFKLRKPVYGIVPYVSRLEYDINDEIGVPSSQVAVLSIHRAELPNWTYVVFGFLPDPINSTMNVVALTLLKSSLIDLFLEQYNLTLTTSVFGKPFSFEMLKFPGGVTIRPEQVSLVTQPLMNFTLNSSIYDIKENLKELKDQLRFGLRLMPNEVVYIQVTNEDGSTKDPPVTVEAFVASDMGTILPERLIKLARIITGSSPPENLGLNHSTFGKVKEISLSSFLNHSLFAPIPAPIPPPTPSPHYPASSPQIPPSLPRIAPLPSGPRPHCGRSISHPRQIFPNLSPQPVVFTPPSFPDPPPSGTAQAPDMSGASPMYASLAFLNARSYFVLGTWRIQRLYLTRFLIFVLLFWIL